MITKGRYVFRKTPKSVGASHAVGYDLYWLDEQSNEETFIGRTMKSIELRGGWEAITPEGTVLVGVLGTRYYAADDLLDAARMSGRIPS